MIREDRYIVLKIKDMELADLSVMELAMLDAICTKLRKARQKAGKEPLEAIVVERDWPEYEAVWAMIQKRVDGP